MLTRSAAYELAPFGIRVNTISPGLTATKANAVQWRDRVCQVNGGTGFFLFVSFGLR